MENKIFRPETDLRRMWVTVNVVMLFLVLLAIVVAWLLGLDPIVCLIAEGGYILLVYIPVAFYIPAFFRTLEYEMGADSIVLKKGVFWRRRTTVPYTKITNIDITQGPVERMYKISTLHLQTAGSSGGETGKAEIVIPGIRDCEILKDYIAQRAHKAVGTPVASVPIPETDTMSMILAELKGLREDLQKKQN